MSKNIFIAVTVISFAFNMAFGQKVNINIRQRPDGGQSVSGGRLITNEDQAEQSDNRQTARQTRSQTIKTNTRKVKPASASEVFKLISTHSRKVEREIENLGRILDKTNEAYRTDFTTIMSLPASAYGQRDDMRIKNSWLYLRCGSLYPTDPKSMEACLTELAQVQADNPEYLKYLVHWKMLIGDKAAAISAMEKLKAATPVENAQWIDLMTPLAKLTGKKLELIFEDHSKKTVSTVGENVSIFIFHNGDPHSTKIMAQLGRHYGKYPFCKLIDAYIPTINENARPSAAAIRLPNEQALTLKIELGIKAMPCAIITDPSGQVIYGGPVKDWQLFRAIGHAINAKKTAPIYEIARRQLGYDKAPQESATDTASDSAINEPAAKSSESKYSRVPSEADERAAWQLHADGWDKLRLGLKTHSSAFKAEGIALLKQCVKQYPDTKAAEQARQDLKDVQ